MVCDNRFPVSHLIETFVWWLEQSWDLFALSQHATACDSKLQVAVRNDMRLFLSSTPYWKSTTLYYKVLIQYYSVLPSTTPVLQSATPVLLCTTNYYSSTTLYYKVLLQYYSVLQSTTPVLLRTTQYYSSTTPVLLCTTKYYSGTRKYCSSTTPVLQSTTPVLISHDTLFTMRGATRVSLQLQQVLRLPRKMNLMLDPCHTWNAIYNARRNKCHCPNSPNTAPAKKNESHDWSLSHMKRYLQCAEQHVSLSKLTKYCACHEKWISWLILVTHETLFTMRGATSVIVQTHQILRLPRKMILQNFREISRKKALPGYLFFLPLVFVLFWACNSEMFLFFFGLISSIFLKIKWCQVNDEPGRVAESPLKEWSSFAEHRWVSGHLNQHDH